MTSLSDKEKSGILQELKGDQVQLLCEIHGYSGNQRTPPISGCTLCWTVYYVVQLGQTPPHLRKERLEELEHAVHHAVELEDKGKFDFKVFDHPHVLIDRGGD